MATGTTSDLYAEVDAEIERLKGLSGRVAGREDDGAVIVPHPMAALPPHQSRASPAPINPAQILDNIQRLSAALKASNERVVAADERARRA